LFRGARLAAACEWAARQFEGIPQQSAEFLAASRAQHEGEERRASRRTRRRYQVGAVLAALAVAAASSGIYGRQEQVTGTIQLWDITDPGHPLSLGSPLTGPVGYIYSVAFNPAGNVLAAGSGDDTVWLWDLAQPRQPVYLATLTGPAQAIFSVAFSPNGQTLAAGSQDHTVRLWNTSPQSTAALICATTGTSITPHEWAQYVPGRPYQPPCE